MNRRSIAVVMAGALLSSVAAACGSDEPSADLPPGDTPSQPADSETSEPDSETLEPVTLVVADLDNSNEYSATMAELDELFMERHPHITIDRTGSPYNDHFTKIQTAIAAQQGPDAVFLYPGLAAADFYDALIPVDDYLAAATDLNQNIQFVAESRGPDGQLYTVPWLSYTYLIATNKALFEQAGIDRDFEPTTWDELLQLCRDLDNAGIVPFAAGWQDGYYFDWFWFILLSQTLSPEELEQMIRAELAFDTEPFRLAAEYLLELVDANCFDPNATGIPLGEVTAIWESGQAAMNLVATPDERWADTVGVDDIGLFIPPELPSNRWGEYPVTDAGPAAGWGVTAWTEHPDEAWLYVSFLLEPANQAAIWDGANIVPNHVEAEVSSDVAFVQEWLDLALIPANHTAYTSLPISVQGTLEKAAVPFVTGQLTVDELLGQLEAERQRALR